MNLKSYMRGIGIGMIVAAATLHFTFAASGQSMTDEEIKARATELGMIENTVLKPQTASENDTSVPDADIDPVNENTVREEMTISNNNSVSDCDLSEESDIIEESDASASDNIIDEADLKAPEEPMRQDESEIQEEAPPIHENESEAVNYVVVQVVSGDSSYSVAKKVAEAGLVESAAEYDQYLCANGYDKTLTVGNHRIPEDATEEEIARLLTSKGN